MIHRVKIHGFKSLHDVDVELRPLSVLVGPNAAGKSNLFDALQLLSRIATGRTLQEAFAPPYRGQPLESFTLGPKGVTGLLARESAAFSIEVDVALSPSVVDRIHRRIGELRRVTESDRASNTMEKKREFVREKRLRYAIEVRISPKSGILCVVNEYLAALTDKWDVHQNRKPYLEKVNDRLRLRMEGQAHPTDLDLYTDSAVISRPHYAPHYPHLTAIREELANWFFYYFEPRERMRSANPVKEVRHIGLMGEDLAAFLNTLRAVDERQFRAIERAMRAIIPSVSGLEVEISNLGEVEIRILEGGIPVPARVASEGTLRVLGLLALGGVKDPPAVIGFEEPENGVHPRRIRLIAELLRSRVLDGTTQVLATTHSLVLADVLPPDCLYVCRKIDGRTDILPFDSLGPLFKPGDISKSLDDEAPESVVSSRLLRGDFDA